MHAVKFSQLRSFLLSSDDSGRCVVEQRVDPISATQSCTPDKDVERSPFTVAEIYICRRRPPLDDDGPTNLLGLGRTSSRFPVSLPVLGREDHITLLVLTTSLVVFITAFY